MNGILNQIIRLFRGYLINYRGFINALLPNILLVPIKCKISNEPPNIIRKKTNSKKTNPKSVKKIMEIKKGGNVMNKHQKRNPKPRKTFSTPNPPSF